MNLIVNFGSELSEVGQQIPNSKHRRAKKRGTNWPVLPVAEDLGESRPRQQALVLVREVGAEVARAHGVGLHELLVDPVQRPRLFKKVRNPGIALFLIFVTLALAVASSLNPSP